MLQAGCVCGSMSDLLICVESEWFIRDMNFHYVEPGRRDERQGPVTWYPSETMGKLIKAVTQQTVLMKLRGPTGCQAGGFMGNCIWNVLQ